MTIEEMQKWAYAIDKEPVGDLAEETMLARAGRWRIAAALCERMDAQNALLEKIAVALEAGRSAPRGLPIVPRAGDTT